MEKEEIQNLIKELIEKTTVKLNKISIIDDKSKNIWISAEVSEPHFFINREGEGLHALSYLVHRIIENKITPKPGLGEPQGLGVIIDINGFQKKHIENIRAIAHMMSERARYFKSNIEIDPMSAFERRIVHEFLSEANDLKTESTGFGRDRRVVIKYIGAI
ncbi:MAG: R3H domain-containing nucleic acid-binding protein [Candidatus Paceibacterota bacterium]|jgi:spoIIIJ-associated protein